MRAREIHNILVSLGDAAVAEHSKRFFKTGKGEYGEGDIFLGIRVPALRKQVRRYRDISPEETLLLLKSPFHEERLFALLVLVDKFSRGGAGDRTAIYEMYLSNTQYINNWDLVDSSAPYIVGAYLEKRDKKPIFKLAGSGNLWERRIAVLSTFHLIKRNDFSDALEISEILIQDREDLIHKAVGWMLREIGKRDLPVEKTFLDRNCREMPRTMLRYAIERFPEKERKRYMEGTAQVSDG
ncbi:MAG: DNA alkylation repair enzyme [Syntrophorhabdus sp. PtaU1.Bin058]|nr:MAG: DNA alkylation repair enzyme [Syntrophorhabdus sp. PtaU1.Bin058]